jgi:hypothetical protein
MFCDFSLRHPKPREPGPFHSVRFPGPNEDCTEDASGKTHRGKNVELGVRNIRFYFRFKKSHELLGLIFNSLKRTHYPRQDKCPGFRAWGRLECVKPHFDPQHI